MPNKLKEKEWKFIIIALKTMKETFNFIRGFGKKSKGEIFCDKLINKIELFILKDE